MSAGVYALMDVVCTVVIIAAQKERGINDKCDYLY